ncbi:hypothetical protein PC116_g11813 [Phytophthora cactorum]|nr:hypothetical protein PC116_g11813 [Phytophthora cactorum]
MTSEGPEHGAAAVTAKRLALRSAAEQPALRA